MAMNQYLQSCQSPTGLSTKTLDEDKETDEVFLDDHKQLDTSDIHGQTIKGAVGGQEFPKTSTPAKKEATRDSERGEDETGSSTADGAKSGAGDTTLDGGCCSKKETPPESSSPRRCYQVPEPVAEISVIASGDSTSAVDLRNPDIRPSSGADIAGAEFLESLQSDFSSTMFSLAKSAEEFERFKKGYIRQCSRSNLRHSKSTSDIRSLTNSVSSQQEEIQYIEEMMRLILEELGKSKGRFEALEKRQAAGRKHTQQTTSTHFIPYDSLKQLGESLFVLETTDMKMRTELFLQGFGSGRGTHLSLRVTADSSDSNEMGQLSPQCRLQTRVSNFEDEEETRKKSKKFEVTGSGLNVEFPKLIEKDVVENKALGYKKNGMLKIILIVSWDEVTDP